MGDNQEKIFCPVYEVWNSRYACARRYENANQVTGNPYDKGGPGFGDLACRECEIGKQMMEAGEGKPKKQTAVIRPKEVGMGEEKMAEAEKEKKCCNKCLVKKQLSEFAINRATKDGLDYYCKQCRAEERRNKKRRGKTIGGPLKARKPSANEKDKTKISWPASIPQPNGCDPAIATTGIPASKPRINELNSFLLNLALLLERFRAEMVCREDNLGINVHVGGKITFIGQPRLPRPGEDIINNAAAEV